MTTKTRRLRGKARPFLAGFLFLLWTFAGGAPAQAAVMKDSLQGLKRVYVSVEGITPTLESFGMTVKEVREGVERTLREAGLQALTQQEWMQAPERPCLSIFIRTYRYPGSPAEGGDLTAYSVDVRFFQSVSLLRDPAILVMSPTWSSESTLGVTREKNLGLLKDTIAQFVGRFLGDCASVNPQPAAESGLPLRPPSSRPGGGQAATVP